VQIWHRISFSSKLHLEHKLESLGITLERSHLPGGHYLVTCNLDEMNRSWQQAEPLLRNESVADVVETSFSREEILAAEWIRMRPIFEWGYPEPKLNWPITSGTLTHVCPQCGAGYKQVRPYRISKEPKMGKQDFLCLLWTYTTFCTSRVIEHIGRHDLRGYAIWEALIHHSNMPSLVVSQLLPVNVTSSGFAGHNLVTSITCPLCGTTKLSYHRKGYMLYQRNALPDNTDFALTSEWFGSGSFAFQEILVTNKFASLALSEKWKGIAFKPLQLI
jgi:hypothetical protein